MLHLLHSVTNEEQYKKLEYTQYKKIQTESMLFLREAILWYHESTPRTQRRTTGGRGCRT